MFGRFSGAAASIGEVGSEAWHVVMTTQQAPCKRNAKILVDLIRRQVFVTTASKKVRRSL